MSGGQGSARSSPVGPSGLAVSHLVLSSRTVWVRCPNGEVARRYGVSERNPAGDYWKKIPGSAHWLTGETEGDTGGLDWSVCPSVSPVRLSLCSSDARRRLVGSDSHWWTVPSLDQAPPTDPAKLRPLPHWRRRGRRMGTALSCDISAMSQRSLPEHFNPRSGQPAVRPVGTSLNWLRTGSDWLLSVSVDFAGSALVSSLDSHWFSVLEGRLLALS